MSYLQGFNYSFVPNINLGGLGAFPQVPYAPVQSFSNSNQQQSQQNYANPSGAPPTLSPGSTIPIPDSIVPNPQSYVDYYGNPKQPESVSGNGNFNGNNEIVQQQYNSPQPQQNQQLQFQQQQQFYEPDYGQQQVQQQQQPRRRRPKNGRNRSNSNSVPNYSPDQVQQFQNFQNTQQQQTPSGTNQLLRVTPIQGPIFAKDGYVPVVPLYSYPAVKNGTLLQIPILWTALSYALGLEIRGEILRGLPCIKRLNQLFCPTAGNTYPLSNIQQFIDDNRALIKRMYGEFVMGSETFASPIGSNSLRRSAREIFEEDLPPILGSGKRRQNSEDGILETNDAPLPGNATLGERSKRQTVNPRNGGPTQQPKSNRVDSCESTVEIVTPYWAANSAGKVRAIVNTQHFEQAIHQEVCTKTSTKRCTNDCGCEQKYKWHRLLAYDPDNDCRGIFMDWFLFPSCCVCRCNPIV